VVICLGKNNTPRIKLSSLYVALTRVHYGNNIGIWPCSSADFDFLSKMTYSKQIVALNNAYDEDGVFQESLYKEAYYGYDEKHKISIPLNPIRDHKRILSKSSKEIVPVPKNTKNSSSLQPTRTSTNTNTNKNSPSKSSKAIAIVSVSKNTNSKKSSSSRLIRNNISNNNNNESIESGNATFWRLSANEKSETMSKLCNLSSDSEQEVLYFRTAPNNTAFVNKELMKDEFQPKQLTHGNILDSFLLAFSSQNENNEFVQNTTIIDYAVLLNLLNKSLVPDRIVDGINNSYTKDDFVSKELIGVISYPGHWVICLISSSTGEIQHLDLLDSKQHERDNATISKVVDWHKMMRNKFSSSDSPLEELQYSLKRVGNYENMGKQQDSYSCGIIACALASYWMLYRSIPTMDIFNATSSICEEFRLYMAYTIFKEGDRVSQQFHFNPSQNIQADEIQDQVQILNDCQVQSHKKRMADFNPSQNIPVHVLQDQVQILNDCQVQKRNKRKAVTLKNVISK
jgi:hypothetical protein